MSVNFLRCDVNRGASATQHCAWEECGRGSKERQRDLARWVQHRSHALTPRKADVAADLHALEEAKSHGASITHIQRWRQSTSACSHKYRLSIAHVSSSRFDAEMAMSWPRSRAGHLGALCGLFFAFKRLAAPTAKWQQREKAERCASPLFLKAMMALVPAKRPKQLRIRSTDRRRRSPDHRTFRR